VNGFQLVGPDAAYPLRAPFVLSFVAGYVDSWTYLALFGTFVAQLTGSFVLSGALIVTREPGAVAKQLAIPFFFLAGATVTVLVHSLRERLVCEVFAECRLSSPSYNHMNSASQCAKCRLPTRSDSSRLAKRCFVRSELKPEGVTVKAAAGQSQWEGTWGSR
jgi:hypothetical protein